MVHSYIYTHEKKVEMKTQTRKNHMIIFSCYMHYNRTFLLYLFSRITVLHDHDILAEVCFGFLAKDDEWDLGSMRG